MAVEAVEQNVTPRELNNDTLRKVGNRLKERYHAYKRDRRQAEQEWLKNLRQYNGEYDPEAKKHIPDGKSKAYPRITRMKVMGMVAKLMSLLFPEGEDNFSVAASNKPSVDQETLQFIIGRWAMDNPDQEIDLETVEKQVQEFAESAAKEMSTKIKDQLNDVAEYGQLNYPLLARQVIHSAVLYSMGVLKGPMTIEERGVRFGYGEDGQVTILDDTGYRPYFEFVRLWDYFPDMQANDFNSMDGEFQRHILSKHQLLQLAERSDFFGDRIKAFIRNHSDGNYQEEGYENSLNQLERSNQPSKNTAKSGKFEAVEYWGSVYKSDLAGMGATVEDLDEDEEIQGTVWVLDDVVIKAARSPFPEGAKMYHQFVFEDDDVNLCGSGMPPIVRDSQMGVANSARMLLDNAASVCGPMGEVNVDLLAPGQGGPKFQSFEVVYREGVGADAQVPAVRNLNFDSRIGELLQTMNQFKSLADEETFVSETTTGGTAGIPGEAMRTQGNASMILGNASLPFRDIVRNYDKFTTSVIHSLIQWNRIFDPQSNMDGDLRPIARGSTSLMAKEIRAAALDNLATTLTEEERIQLDMRELARARIQVRDLPENLIRPQEEVEEQQRRLDQEQERQKQLDQAQQQAELRNTQATTQSEQAEAQQTLAEARGEGAATDADRAKAVKDLVDAGVSLQDATQRVTEAQAGQRQTREAEPNAGV